MELWIRSQDKESLLMIKKVFYHCTCNEMESLGEHYIGNKEWVGNKDYTLLGTYRTKERALEVLDEIQRKIKPEYMLRNINRPDEPSQYEGYYEEKPTIIYEMPQE